VLSFWSAFWAGLLGGETKWFAILARRLTAMGNDTVPSTSMRAAFSTKRGIAGMVHPSPLLVTYRPPLGPWPPRCPAQNIAFSG
jgi:hypothetical protein